MEYKFVIIRVLKLYQSFPNGSSASQIKNVGRVQWTVPIFFMALFKVVRLRTNCFCEQEQFP